MYLLNLTLSLVWATLGWTGGPMVPVEATVTSNCAYVESGPVHKCESTVEDWRSFRALQDEHILNGTFTLPEIWEEFFSADVDQISFTPGEAPTLAQGSEAVRLASEQMGQIPIVDVIDHFTHVHVIDGHTVTETFDSTLVTDDSFPFDLRISGTEVAHRKGGQQDWKEDLVVVNVAFVPKAD
ncbi:hypothetical protein ENSA7_18220 [Enhygromyxa salina]|uniref:SnoaL-like domain-containing protein n=2 Tax=Enhygromyxa salina TaxID=215803 RepID=A0A2S9YTW9_9BACT|nr:hypothetical protein ENSA7_18220 [Enhygromyxa salina]